MAMNRNNLLMLGLGAVLAAAAGVASSHAKAGNRFTLVNANDSASIQRVWVSPTLDEEVDWVLVPVTHVVRPNTTSNFNMGVIDECLIDVKVEFDTGKTQLAVGVNICKAAR